LEMGANFTYLVKLRCASISTLPYGVHDCKSMVDLYMGKKMLDWSWMCTGLWDRIALSAWEELLLFSHACRHNPYTAECEGLQRLLQVVQ